MKSFKVLEFGYWSTKAGAEAELSACKHFLSTKAKMSKIEIESLEAISAKILIATAKSIKRVSRKCKY